MSDERRHESLTAFEQQLRSCVPRPARLDRDRLMFLAGQHSVAVSAQRAPTAWQAWGWPLVTAASLLLATYFAWRGDAAPEIRIVERSVAQPATQPLMAENASAPQPVDEQVTEARVASPAPPAAAIPRANTWWDRAEQARGGYLRARDLASRFGIEALPLSLTSYGSGDGPPADPGPSEHPRLRPRGSMDALLDDLLGPEDSDQG